MEIRVDPRLVEPVVEPVPQPHNPALVHNLRRHDQRRGNVRTPRPGLAPALDVETLGDEDVTRWVGQRRVGVRGFPRRDFRGVNRRSHERHVEPSLPLNPGLLRVELAVRNDVKALRGHDRVENGGYLRGIVIVVEVIAGETVLAAVLSHRHREHLGVLRGALLLFKTKLDLAQGSVLAPGPLLRPRASHHLGVLEEQGDDLVDAFKALVGEPDGGGEQAADGIIREPAAADARGDPVREPAEL